MIPPEGQGTAVRHSVLVSAAAAIAVVPILAIAPLVWGPDFDRTLTLGLIMLPGVALLGVGRVMVAAFTGEGAANEALLVGLICFPLTFVAFLLVIPDHGSTGAAVVSCCSYVAASALAAYSLPERTGALGALLADSESRGPARLRSARPPRDLDAQTQGLSAQPVASPEMTSDGAEGRSNGLRRRAGRDRGARRRKTFRIPTHRIDSFKERVVRPVRPPGFARAARAAGRLLRRPPRRVLRHRRAQRVGQEHPAEDPGQHLPGRRRLDPDGRARRPVHRARCRLQPRPDGSRERRAERRDDGPLAERGPPAGSTPCSSSRSSRSSST